MSNEDRAAQATVGFLTDADLVEFVKSGGIENCQTDAISSWEGSDSQIQASSIDLYPEHFHTPGSDVTKTSVRLEPGGAILVYTREKLNLPSDVMGFLSTPTRLSLRGFFCPSVGHIDPGFKGPLKMVGINMGKDPLPLTSGKPVATVVLYRLHAPSAAGYGSRKPRGPEDPRAYSEGLAPDFGNFHKQAGDVARGVLRRAMTPLFLSVIVAAVAVPVITFSLNLTIQEHVQSDALTKQVAALTGRIDTLDKKVAVVEAAAKGPAKTQRP